MGNEGSGRAACIFCGAMDQKMSKEHVWPEWIRNALPQEVLDADHTYAFEDAKRGEFRRVEKQPPFDIKVRDVCEPCNNGWMNRAENAAEPYVLRMLEGFGRELHPPAQGKIAFWGALKALVAQRAFRSSDLLGALNPQDYRDLYEKRDTTTLPGYLAVYTAKTGWSAKQAPAGLIRMTGLTRHDRKDLYEFDGYVLLFSVLDFAAVVLRLHGDELSEFVELPGGPRITKALGRLWPTRDAFIWPPGSALTEHGLRTLAGGEF